MKWLKSDPEAPRLRRWLVGLLVVVACLAVLASTLAIWAHTLVFNTDRWVEVVAPIGKDPAVTQKASVYLTDRAIEASDLQNRIAEALPPRAAFLAAPITEQVRTFTQERLLQVLRDPRVYDLWVKLNRVAHEHLIAVLRGESKVVQLQGDQVQLNLLPLIAKALDTVQQAMPDALGSRITIPTLDPSASPDEMRQQLSTALGRPLPSDFGTVTLFEGQQVSQVQTAVRLFDRLIWLLVIVTVLLVAAAVALSPAKLRTGVQLGIGTVVAFVLARIITHRIEQSIADGLSSQPGSGVAKGVISSAVDNLNGFTQWLIIAGIVVAVAAFLASRPQWFVKAKDWGAVAAGAGEARMSALRSPAHRFIGAHRDGLQVAGVVVALVILFFWTSSIWLAILVIALLAVYEVLMVRFAGPPADGPAPKVS
jgi:hypothetical protein